MCLKNSALLFICVALSFSCKHNTFKTELYSTQNTSSVLLSTLTNKALTLYPILRVDSVKIVAPSQLQDSAGFRYIGNHLLQIKSHGCPISLWQTLLIDSVPYSPIWINDPRLSTYEQFQLSHVLRTLLFEDLDVMFIELDLLTYCSEDSCRSLPVAILTKEEKETFSLLYPNHSRLFIETHKSILIEYLKLYLDYLYKSGDNNQTGGHISNQIVIALNQLDKNYDRAPL